MLGFVHWPHLKRREGVQVMSSFLTITVVASQLSLLSAVAVAAPTLDAFASIASTSLTSIECPAPAQSVGNTIGDPKDNALVGAIVIDPATQPALGSRGARELQGIEIAEIGLYQPALGSKGARELQRYVALSTQPADGARGARELQLPMLAALVQPTNPCSS
jgi:hypothetical protein